MTYPLAAADFDRIGANLTVYVSGDLDAATAPALAETILGLIAADDREIRIDLRQVGFCDSSGLGMLFRLHQAVLTTDASLVLLDPAPSVRRVIAMVDPRGHLDVRSDRRPDPSAAV